jgi:photosystem II stability/assembly factor-like uncharacterized protein
MKKYFLILMLFSILIANAQWKKTPYIFEKEDMNIGVEVSALDGDNIYIGTIFDGLFKSSDNGINWYKTNLPEIGTPRAIDISNGIIYIGTDAQYIQKSTDGGDSWEQIYSEVLTSNLWSIAASGDTIYAASLQHKYESPGTLYRTFDGGDSWEYVTYDTLDFMQIYQIEIKNNYVIVGGNEGIFVSTDYGETWENHPEIYSNWKDIIINENNIYLTRHHGIIHSSNNGNDWNFINVSDSCKIYSVYQYNDKLYAGADSSRIFISSDNGITWDKVIIDEEAIYAKVTSIQSFGDFLYATTINGGKGFYYSSDEGDTWQPRSNIYLKQVVNSIATSQSGLLSGVSDKGIYSSGDNAMNWNKQSIDSDSLKIIGFDTEASYYYAYGLGGVFRSDDFGKNWSAKNEGFEFDDSLNIIDLEATDKYVFATTENKIYKSSDQGDNWNSINTEFSENIKITTIEIYGNRIVLGTKENGIYYSEVENISWKSFNSGIAEDEITGFCITRNKLFASTMNSGIYVTEDFNDKWYARNQNIIHFSISYLYSDSKNIFAITPMGIMYSSDNGVEWSSINEGLEGNEEFCDFIVSDDEYLYTHITNENSKEFASYRVDKSYFNITNVEQLSKKEAFLISPNPAEDYIEITINKPSCPDFIGAEGSDIEIYDVLGEKIMSESIHPMTRSHRMNVSNLPRGVYFVRIVNRVEKFVKR